MNESESMSKAEGKKAVGEEVVPSGGEAGVAPRGAEPAVEPEPELLGEEEGGLVVHFVNATERLVVGLTLSAFPTPGSSRPCAKAAPETIEALLPIPPGEVVDVRLTGSCAPRRIACHAELDGAEGKGPVILDFHHGVLCEGEIESAVLGVAPGDEDEGVRPFGVTLLSSGVSLALQKAEMTLS